MIDKEEELKEKIIGAFNALKSGYGYEVSDVFRLLSVYTIPVTVFSTGVPPLRAMVKYLKENSRIELTDVANLIKRDYRAVWGAYDKSPKKQIIPSESEFFIPLNIFNKKLSILESVVYFLKKNYGLRFSKIANLLKRDQRTIWTVYNRAKKKDEK